MSNEIDHTKHLAPAEGGPKAAGDTDWRKAFGGLTLILGTGFISSDQFSKAVDQIREHCGEEPADLMVELFNSTRSEWMQGFMG